MHDHDCGGQRPTDRCIDSDDEQDRDQDQEWFKCALCGTRYRSRRTAMQCCSECFDDPDHDPRSPPVAMTDGGHCATGTEQAPGTLVLVDHGTRETWHHSISFDGDEHATACGQGVGCGATDEVRMDISEWFDLETRRCCDECAGSVRSLATNNEQEEKR